MRRSLGLAVVFAVLVALVVPRSAQAADAEPPQLQAGAATSNLTPPLGLPIVGGFSPAPSKHIHDELHARCLVLDDGETRLALVVCDLLGIHRSVSDVARQKVQEQTGIPPANVLICATHTHSASSALANRWDQSQELDDYQKFVAQRIADGVQRAANLLRPAQIAFGTVDVPEHVNNRRWFMKAGTVPPNPFDTIDLVKMNPPAGSENLLEPAGPTDPGVSFLAVREPDGRPISLFASYSLHYVGGTGPSHISADYFAVFSERVADLLSTREQDPPFVAMLSNGTSGDINNNNFVTPRGRRQPYEQMKYVAHDVAEKVVEQLGSLSYRDRVKLDARYREPVIGMRRPTEDELAWAKKTLENPGEPAPGRANLPVIYAERTMRLAEAPETAPMPLQVLKIGDVAIGTMPCEVFCEIGLEFKDRSPVKPAFLVSLAHGYYGYLPTPRHFRLGGYETWIGTNRLEQQASVKMLDNLLEMAAEMK